MEIAGNTVTELPDILDIRCLLSVLTPREEEVLLLRLEALEMAALVYLLAWRKRLVGIEQDGDGRE